MTEKASDGSASSRLDRRRRSAKYAANESYAAKQREIIEAAVHLFAENGYEATRLSDIADAVKMDRATLYYYFKSKTQLLGSALNDVGSSYLRTPNEIVASDVDPLAKVRAAMKSVLTTVVEDYPIPSLYLQDDIWRSPSNTAWIDPLRAAEAGVYEALGAVIEEGQIDGLIRDDVPAALIARIVFGSVSWSYRWLKPGIGISLEEVIDSFDAILAGGLVPKKKARAADAGVVRSRSASARTVKHPA